MAHRAIDQKKSIFCRPKEKAVYEARQYCRKILGRVSKWSLGEQSLLIAGVRQANQKILLDRILDEYSGEEARQKIQDIDRMRDVDLLMNTDGIDWNVVSSAHLNGMRTPEECRIQWTVQQHPIINKGEWSKEEVEKLAQLVVKYGPNGRWTEIAEELGSNRPAWACLSTFQRRLNPDFLKGRWTPDEDVKLLALTKKHTIGTECNWTAVSLEMGDRTTPQCTHRYFKTLNPIIRRGRWTVEEDELLKLGVSLHGARDWFLVCKWVPGRTDVQCRERWMNVLHPSLKLDPFTEEEDELLVKVVEEAGGPGSWSSIQSKHFPGRTDSQLRRRWRQLVGPEQDPYSKPKKQEKHESVEKPKKQPEKKRGRPRKHPLPQPSAKVQKRIPPNFERRQSSRRRDVERQS